MDSKLVIEKEKPFIDQISDKYDYDDNIRHLLYIIIPAFIIKYGIKNESLILNTFRDIRIIKSDKQDRYVKAYYSSHPIYEDGKYSTVKFMVIQNYNKISLIDLLDNLVHEFNHAVNSYRDEIRVTKNYVYLRTGLTYRVYKKDPISFVRKDPSYLLEEIINTKQTEDVINIIKSFDGENRDISNTIYAINNETNHKYNSNSYYLESYACRQILENRTFINTLANLRLVGEVFNITKWFDDITGKDGSYKELISLLNKIYDLEKEYIKRKLFKSITLGKIRETSREIMRIVETFNNNVNYR
jgi:hypothetical protein